MFYEALDLVGKRVSDAPPIDVFTQAVDNVKPSIEVRSKRVGGATYQVPTPVNAKRQQTLALRWILEAVRSQKGRPIAQSLANELVNAYKRGRDGHDDTRKRAPDGRSEQSLCPLRLVSPHGHDNRAISTTRLLPEMPGRLVC